MVGCRPCARVGRRTDKAPAVGTKVASFTFRDYRGAETSLEQFAAKKAVVLAFVGCECPVARLYGPRLATLAKDYEAKGVQFLGIDSNQQDGVSQIARFAKEAGIEFPILKDVNNVLADQLGVERTTEVIVLDAERTIRYRGRIDNQYNVGISRTKSTENDLCGGTRSSCWRASRSASRRHRQWAVSSVGYTSRPPRER